MISLAHSTIQLALEQIEIEAWSDLARTVPSSVAASCGIKTTSLGGAFVHIASKVDVLAVNRVIGLGLSEPGTDQTIDHIIASYHASGVARFFVQVTPNALPRSIVELLKKRGFTHHNSWAKLYREVGSAPIVESSQVVQTAGLHEAGLFAEIVQTSFSWPQALRGWVASSVGKPHWRHYLAFDGNTAVGAAAMFVQGDYAWFSFAATREQYRGTGTQSALIARRILDCSELGVKWIIVETAEDTPAKPSTSYRNLTRLGFNLAYLRQNFIHTSQPAAAAS